MKKTKTSLDFHLRLKIVDSRSAKQTSNRLDDGYSKFPANLLTIELGLWFSGAGMTHVSKGYKLH